MCHSCKKHPSHIASCQRQHGIPLKKKKKKTWHSNQPFKLNKKQACKKEKKKNLGYKNCALNRWYKLSFLKYILKIV